MHLTNHPIPSGLRRVSSAHAATLAAAASAFAAPSERFVLFIAADTQDDDGAALVEAAAAFVRAGAGYVCCWGRGCERLHDAFDEADLAMNGESTDHRFLLTTWHADETLEEAVWFATHAARPAPAYEAETGAVVALSVGSAEWAARVRAYLDAGAPQPDEG